MSRMFVRLSFAAIVLMVLASLGCASIPFHPSGVSVPDSHATLKSGLNWLILVGALTFAAGWVSYVAMPGLHSVATAIVVGGAALIGVALFIQAILPAVVWIVGGIVIVAAVFLGYQGYMKFVKK